MRTVCGKDDPRVQLDFSAIGAGYRSDVIGNFCGEGYSGFFVELGGEGCAELTGRKTDHRRSVFWT